MITSPVMPTVWRAPTDNDRKIKRQWYAAGYDKLTLSCSMVSADIHKSAVTVTVNQSLENESGDKLITMLTAYRISPDGVKISTRASLKEGLPPLPRFGFRFNTPEIIENLRYFGYGPNEAYEDKRLAARLGLFRTTLTDNFVDYIRPQENGAHCYCRFADISAHHGVGLYFSSKSFSLSASHYSPELLTKTAHSWELTPDREGTVIIDYRNAGIGSESCGPTLLPEYRISERDILFSFYIRPTLTASTFPFSEYRE